MRILTVRQPWVWAIIHGGKDVENRVRNIAGSYRGPVAIHVALADAEHAPESLWLRHADWYRDRSDKPRAEFPGTTATADSSSAWSTSSTCTRSRPAD